MDQRPGDCLPTPASREPLRPQAPSTFVGCDEEVDYLTQALALSANGTGGSIWLAG